VPAGTEYVIRISWDNGADDNYSPQFIIESTVTSASQSPPSVSSSSVPATSTSTETSASTSTSSSSLSSNPSATESQTFHSVTSLTSTSSTTVPGQSGSSGTVSSNSQGASATVTVTVVKSDSNVGAIVGGVVGGIAVIVLVLLGMYFFYRRGKRRGLQEAGLAGASVEPKTKEQTMASGNLDQRGNFQAQDSMDGANLETDGNKGIAPISHAIRYFDEERLGTASD
jgi:hypothetical protein